MAASGLEGDEEKERLSAVLPPGATVAEERAKPGCACKSWLNRHTSSDEEYKTPEKMLIFIKLGGATKGGPCAEGQDYPWQDERIKSEMCQRLQRARE